MHSISRGAILGSFLLAFSVTAQNNGQASNGDFQFDLAGASGSIQYDARGQGSGVHGQMTFAGATELSNEDVDGNGNGGSSVSNMAMTVSFDCLKVQGNRAAMSGVVTSSSVPEYIGTRALLAVEDNGEGKHASSLDRFTWGVYRNPANTWVPSDAEVPGDNGAMFTWYATDAERFDDVGRPSSQNQNGTVDCKSFGFDSYAFEALPLGAGQIQVKP